MCMRQYAADSTLAIPVFSLSPADCRLSLDNANFLFIYTHTSNSYAVAEVKTPFHLPKPQTSCESNSSPEHLCVLS